MYNFKLFFFVLLFVLCCYKKNKIERIIIDDKEVKVGFTLEEKKRAKFSLL